MKTSQLDLCVEIVRDNRVVFNSLVVVCIPQRFVYKCLNSAGNKREVIGYISRSVEFTPDPVTWDPLEDEVCSRCKFSPLGSGGGLWNKLHGLHSRGYHRDPQFINKLLKLYHEYTREKKIQPLP